MSAFIILGIAMYHIVSAFHFLGNMDSYDPSDESNPDLSGEDMVTESADVNLSMNESMYVPTPERHFRKNLSQVSSRQVAFMDFSELGISVHIHVHAFYICLLFASVRGGCS